MMGKPLISGHEEGINWTRSRPNAGCAVNYTNEIKKQRESKMKTSMHSNSLGLDLDCIIQNPVLFLTLPTLFPHGQSWPYPEYKT